MIAPGDEVYVSTCGVRDYFVVTQVLDDGKSVCGIDADGGCYFLGTDEVAATGHKYKVTVERLI